MTYDLTHKFEMNGKTYRTDQETIELLRPMVASYRAGAEGMLAAIATVMTLGLQSGRVEELQTEGAL